MIIACLPESAELATQCFLVGAGGEKKTFSCFCKGAFEGCHDFYIAYVPITESAMILIFTHYVA